MKEPAFVIGARQLRFARDLKEFARHVALDPEHPSLHSRFENLMFGRSKGERDQAIIIVKYLVENPPADRDAEVSQRARKMWT